MVEGMAYGDLPFPDTGCPETDVGFNYFIALYQVKWLAHCEYIILIYLQ